MKEVLFVYIKINNYIYERFRNSGKDMYFKKRKEEKPHCVFVLFNFL